ncbi:MAG: acyl-CoA-binding protein [Actinomycetia bacterium]|nr:acyl-CoA-binding protein [Actinomycetes bacterium]
MSQITDFTSAVAAVERLRKDPGNATKLKLYALYKQACEGDVTGSRPGFTNPVGRAKYDAWASLEGYAQEDAEAEYIDQVQQLCDAEDA